MRPTQTPPRGVRELSDAGAPDFLEGHRVALLAFLDPRDAASAKMRERVALVAAKWEAAGPAHERPAADARAAFGAGVVDVSRDRLVAEALGVKSVPTVVLFVDGAVVDRLMGGAPEAVLDEMVGTRVRGLSGPG